MEIWKRASTGRQEKGKSRSAKLLTDSAGPISAAQTCYSHFDPGLPLTPAAPRVGPVSPRGQQAPALSPRTLSRRTAEAAGPSAVRGEADLQPGGGHSPAHCNPSPLPLPPQLAKGDGHFSHGSWTAANGDSGLLKYLVYEKKKKTHKSIT